MGKSAAALVLALLALMLISCGNDAVETPADSLNGPASVPGPAVNPRGAIAVALGEPVEITADAGQRIVRITNTRLDTTGCELAHPEVQQTKLVATLEIGTQTTAQWLWPSDIYYVDAAGKVARNQAVAEAVDSSTPCADSEQFIDVPPNSSADGSPILTIPLVTVAIGYHLKLNGVDHRVEWTLPADWAAAVSPATSVTATTTQDPVPADTAEPEPTATLEEPIAACADGEVVNEGGGTYSTCTGGEWVYVSPTFDPNSGDGYGPNQPLPPLCVRFPDDYDC